MKSSFDAMLISDLLKTSNASNLFKLLSILFCLYDDVVVTSSSLILSLELLVLCMSNLIRGGFSGGAALTQIWPLTMISLVWLIGPSTIPNWFLESLEDVKTHPLMPEFFSFCAVSFGCNLADLAFWALSFILPAKRISWFMKQRFKISAAYFIVGRWRVKAILLATHLKK